MRSLVVMCLAVCIAHAARAQAPLNAAPPAPADGHIRVSGGVWIRWYQPVGDRAGGDPRSRVDLHYAFLTADRETKWGGAHLEARARDDRFRPYYSSNVWLQEAYAFANLGGMRYAAGKITRRLGPAADGSFYGPIAYYDGVVSDPDDGVSIESTSRLGTHLTMTRVLQYFVHEDGVNGSLRDSLGTLGARDVEGESTARERNTWVGRIALEATLNGWYARPAVSVSTGHVERDGATGNNVTMASAEFTLCREPNGLGTRITGDVTARNGRAASDFPVSGGAANALYWHAGVVKVGLIGALRYNISGVTYKNTGVREIMHQPGLSIALGRTSAVYVEYVIWQRVDSGGIVRQTTTLDKSVNVAVKAAL